MRSTSARVGLAIGLALGLASLLPAAAVSAAPNPNGCGQYGAAINFTMPLPDSIRSLGTHQYEFYSSWTGGSEDDVNSVTFDNAAPIYPGDVYVRLFYLMVLQSDGSVSFDITTLNPAQRARFAVTWFTIHNDPVFNPSIQVSVRWETSPGVWSDWVVLPKGPTTSVCAPGGVSHYGGFFQEAWGWGG